MESPLRAAVYAPASTAINAATRNDALRDLRLKLEAAELAGQAFEIPAQTIRVVLELLPQPHQEEVVR